VQTIDLPDDELPAVAAAIRRAIEDDNIPTIEDLCRAGGVDGYVRARVAQAVAQAVAEVSKRARIEALEECKRVLDAYDPDGPFKIIAGGPFCREELRGEDITDIVVAGERRTLRRRLCPKPATDEIRSPPHEHVRRYRTQTPEERYVIREARAFDKRRWDDVRLNHAEQAGRMKALREAIAKGAKLNRTPGILAEPTEPGSARKAIEEAMAKLESDRANRGQAKAKAKRDGAPSS
jgi:hypothetical protein